jgi:hypothetical protein
VELQSVILDGRSQPIRLEGREITLPIRPGEQQVKVVWQQAQGLETRFQTPEVDLGAPSVNASIELVLAEDRWILFLGGPPLGPAVQFWGVLPVLLLAAILLSRLSLTPLRLHHWLLLGIGLTQSPVWVPVLVVGWLLVLGWRARIEFDIPIWRFNLTQFALALLSLLALGLLFDAVAEGLMGAPQMQIAGNGSQVGFGPAQLNWYQDRLAGPLPQAWAFSAPMLLYRLLMLAWALWLAFALLRWLKWGWDCYSTHGLWRKIAWPAPRPPRHKSRPGERGAGD